MKSIVSILGILFLVTGIVTLTYQGITYTKQEKVAELGPVTITAEHPKTIYFPPILGGLLLVAGLVLVVVARK
jgi:predicted transporter